VQSTEVRVRRCSHTLNDSTVDGTNDVADRSGGGGVYKQATSIVRCRDMALKSLDGGTRPPTSVLSSPHKSLIVRGSAEARD
jgi:hypothetical protein